MRDDLPTKFQIMRMRRFVREQREQMRQALEAEIRHHEFAMEQMEMLEEMRKAVAENRPLSPGKAH